MPINPLVLELLEKAAESGLSAEEVCRDRPELLGEVRACLRQLSSVRDELDALFPEEGRPETPPSSARPEIPGYSVGEIIGRGGMGVVYKARHLRLNRPVAVKMMLNGGFAGPPELERFQHEAEALAALHHPNIVQVYDVGESGALPYFTMEFVDGGNLAQKQHGVPQSARDAAALMILLADAVEAAHRGGIVHRDLKPSNILMTSDGKPKITDFGLARRFEAGAGPSMTGTRIGTPGYMAPEQVAGHARVSGVATDVYALGAILYEMITGRPPFHAETPAATERQVIAEEPAPPARLNSRVPRDLETICLKCLQKEPRRRYSSAGELGEDIGRFLRNEPIKARPVCSVERAGKWMRRHPARAVSLFGGLTISAVMLVGGWWVFTERSLATHEIEEDLRIAKQALRRSDWGEARSALERARGRLGRGERGELRRRLDQAGRDYDLVRRLAAIRMDRISKTEAGAAHWPGEYEKAFRQAGLLDMDDAPQVAASKLGESDIKDALVAAIDDWALCDYVNDDRRGEAWLLEVARRSDPDPQGWRDRLRDPSVRRNQQELARLADSAEMDEAPVNLLISLGELMWRTEGDAVPFLHAIQRHHPNDIMANCLLGYDALKRKDMPEAIRSYQAALAIRPGTPFLYGALAVALARDGKSTEAISYYSEAVRLDPENEYLRTSFGDSLAAVGRVTEAAEQFERALQITRRDPWRLVVRKKLRACRSRLGDIDAVDALWRRIVEASPPDDEAWDGYAEFCLFRGRPDEYRTTCIALLRHFGATGDVQRAERTGRACILLPASSEILEQATGLIDRALADKRPELAWAHPYFRVAKGLAEYRHGRLESAVSIMDGPASNVLQAAPHLVSAMARHRLGREEEALRTFAAAILKSDWRKSRADAREKWIYHVLRREAEALMLPDLLEFLNGRYQPRTNDEKICLLGACQFEERYRAAAEIYTEVLASDPHLAGDLYSKTRYRAACTATWVGAGRGQDAGRLDEPERLRWRNQARQWLRADLDLARTLSKSDARGLREFLKNTLDTWLTDPDLSGLRDPNACQGLLPSERQEFRSLCEELRNLVVDPKT